MANFCKEMAAACSSEGQGAASWGWGAVHGRATTAVRRIGGAAAGSGRAWPLAAGIRTIHLREVATELSICPRLAVEDKQSIRTKCQ